MRPDGQRLSLEALARERRQARGHFDQPGPQFHPHAVHLILLAPCIVPGRATVARSMIAPMSLRQIERDEADVLLRRESAILGHDVMASIQAESSVTDLGASLRLAVAAAELTGS
jgi:hypothetical protein